MVFYRVSLRPETRSRVVPIIYKFGRKNSFLSMTKMIEPYNFMDSYVRTGTHTEFKKKDFFF